MSVLFRSAGAATLLLIAFLIGCKGGERAAKGDEVELFASAQEMQKDEKFDVAVKIYRQIARDFPDSRQGANSQFMIGYIYANHIKDLEQAKIELNRFLERYADTADSGLVAGARFELQYMGRDIDDIPILSELGKGDTIRVMASEAGEEGMEEKGE